MMPGSALMPPRVRLPPALEERTPSPPPRLPPNTVQLDAGSYETHDVKHNKRVMSQKNIVYPSPVFQPQAEPSFKTTLDIDWDLVNRQRQKNEALIGDFLQKRATREILRCAGLRQDRRRTATSIPLDSVKPVPGATYFKTEGNKLKVDIDRGVKWSKSKGKWVAKTMYAGKIYPRLLPGKAHGRAGIPSCRRRQTQRQDQRASPENRRSIHGFAGAGPDSPTTE